MSYATSREPRVDLEDLRDDTIAVVLNSGLSFRQVQEAGGPTSQTLSKWLYKETKFPRLDTVRSILQVCGHELRVVPTHEALPKQVDSMITKLRPQARESLPKRKNLRAWNRLRKNSARRA